MFKTIISKILKLLGRFFKRLFNSYNSANQGGLNMAIVTVEKNRYTTDSLYQWDKNQVLEIRGLSLSSIPEIHFTNNTMDRAIVRQASMDDAGVITVNVPNSLLQKPYSITAYVCVYEGETFESLHKIAIPVNARPKPNDYILEVTDEEVYSFNALENLVNNAVVNMTAKCNETVNMVNTKCDDTMKSVGTAHDKAVESVNTKCSDGIGEIDEKVVEAIGEIDEKVVKAVATLEGSSLVSQSQLDEVSATANSAYNGARKNSVTLDNLTTPVLTVEGLTFQNCYRVVGGINIVNQRVFVNITVVMTSDVDAMTTGIVTGLPKAINNAFLDLRAASYDNNSDAWIYEYDGEGQIIPRKALVKDEMYHIIGEYFSAV